MDFPSSSSSLPATEQSSQGPSASPANGSGADSNLDPPAVGELLDAFERQFSAEKGMDMEVYGANRYSNFYLCLWDVIRSFFTCGAYGSVEDNEAKAERTLPVLRTLNEHVFEAYTNMEKKDFQQKIQIGKMSLSLTIHKRIDRIELIIDGEFRSISMTGAEITNKLRKQTKGHDAFSMGIKESSLIDKNEIEDLVNQLKEVRSPTRVLPKKTSRGNKIGAVSDSEFKEGTMEMVPGVKIGINFDRGKKIEVHNKVTASYFRDMLVVTWGAESSQSEASGSLTTYNSQISAAALATVFEVNEGMSRQVDLQKNLHEKLRSLSINTQNTANMDVVGGVFYLDPDDTTLKLFSYRSPQAKADFAGVNAEDLGKEKPSTFYQSKVCVIEFSITEQAQDSLTDVDQTQKENIQIKHDTVGSSIDTFEIQDFEIANAPPNGRFRVKISAETLRQELLERRNARKGQVKTSNKI